MFSVDWNIFLSALQQTAFWCHSTLETQLITRSCLPTVESEQRELIVLWDISSRLFQNLEKLSCFFVKAHRSSTLSSLEQSLKHSQSCSGLPHPILISDNILEIYLIRTPLILVILVITYFYSLERVLSQLLAHLILCEGKQSRYYPHFIDEKRGAESLSDFVKVLRLHEEMRMSLGHLTHSLMSSFSLKANFIQSMLSHICFLFKRCTFLTLSPSFRDTPNIKPRDL